MAGQQNFSKEMNQLFLNKMEAKIMTERRFQTEREAKGDDYKFCYDCNYFYGDDECNNCIYYDDGEEVNTNEK